MPEYRKERSIKVFISYANEDLKDAAKIYDRLQLIDRIEPWLDRERLLPGQKWQTVIENRIGESDFFILLLSNKTIHKTGFIQKEIREALKVLETLPEDKIFLIVARLERCTPHFKKLRPLHYVDMFPDWEEGFRKIRRVLIPKEDEQFETINGRIERTKRIISELKRIERRADRRLIVYQQATFSSFAFSEDPRFVKGESGGSNKTYINLLLQEKQELNDLISHDQTIFKLLVCPNLDMADEHLLIRYTCLLEWMNANKDKSRVDFIAGEHKGPNYLLVSGHFFIEGLKSILYTTDYERSFITHNTSLINEAERKFLKNFHDLKKLGKTKKNTIKEIEKRITDIQRF